MIRWLDFNDTWLAAEWGHPSDNLGSILAVADYLSRNNVAQGKSPLTMKDVLVGMIKAHEIQGCLALENSFNRVGLDHVLLVRVASTAVSCTALLIIIAWPLVTLPRLPVVSGLFALSLPGAISVSIPGPFSTSLFTLSITFVTILMPMPAATSAIIRITTWRA